MGELFFTATPGAIYVVATTIEGTRAAVTIASLLSRGSDSRLIVLVPTVTTYAAAVRPEATITASLFPQYRDLVRGLAPEARCRLCLCRTLDDLVTHLLPSGATVVVGGLGGGVPYYAGATLMQCLLVCGCRVVFVPVGGADIAPRQRSVSAVLASIVAVVLTLVTPRPALAQPPVSPDAHWHMSGFVDAGFLADVNDPLNHLFRNRGTTPRVDEVVINMAGFTVAKNAIEVSRWGAEVTAHAGRDASAYGFSPTAPKVPGADWLTHLGPTNVSYVASVGLTVQGGIFNSLIGYDSLYAKDNFTYTRPWGAEYTPYLMVGANASYPVGEKATATVAVVNGYWHLAHANDVPSVVGQFAVKASDGITVKETVLAGPHQPNTAMGYWRVLSDTIIEQKSDRVTAAFELQLGAETVDAPGRPRALWASAQLPVQWTLRQPWRLTLRPEVAWDRDGRWMGAPQSVMALTSTVEYRLSHRRTQTILRLEYRFDDSHGAGGGFYDDGLPTMDVPPLVPTQHLLIVAAVVRVG